MEHPPYDPREFTPAEWGLVIKALDNYAAYLDIKVGYKYGHVKDQLAAAAERYHDLSRLCVNARIFCREYQAGSSAESILGSGGNGAGSVTQEGDRGEGPGVPG